MLERTTMAETVAPVSPDKTKLKVLYISHNHPQISPGGAEVYALELYEAMRAAGDFEPLLVARAEPPTAAAASSQLGSPFVQVGEDENQYFFYAKGSNFDALTMASKDKATWMGYFQDFLRAHRPKVVHFQHTLFLGVDLIRQIRNLLPDAAIVYTLHEYLPICHRNGQMVRAQNNELCNASSPVRCHECFPGISAQAFFSRKRFLQSHFSLVDLFLAPSHFLLERYVEWGIPRAKIRYEEYGRRGDKQRGNYAEDRPRNRLGFFGQMNPFKGVDVLLKAMQILGTDTPAIEPSVKAHLWVHGANLESQRGEFRHQMVELLEASSGNVTFAGSYQQSDLPTRMANIDWVIVPSIWWENSPLVIQEAFLHGRPVICSDIGGMAEKVTDGVNGLHFRVGDPSSLAHVIQRAAETPGLWDRLHHGIPDVYKMVEQVATLSTIYRTLLSERCPE